MHSNNVSIYFSRENIININEIPLMIDNNIDDLWKKCTRPEHDIYSDIAIMQKKRRVSITIYKLKL